jgi:hypothetical protein
LSDLQHPLPPDSLIPMFEGMVDRALSRTQSPPAVPEGEAAKAKAAAMPMSGLSIPGMVDRISSKR